MSREDPGEADVATDGGDAESGPPPGAEGVPVDEYEGVIELDEGRFVISSSGEPNVDESTLDGTDADETGAGDSGADEVGGDVPGPVVDDAAVEQWLIDSFRDDDALYGFDITANCEGTVDRHRFRSDDVVETFDRLLRWYASGVDRGTPPEVVLGILLSEANVPVRFPVKSLRDVLDENDLSPDDSVRDLLDVAVSDGGLEFSSR